MSGELVLHGVTETALVLPDDLPLEAWEQTGRKLGQVDSARQWWVGDWLNYGERAYGETYAQGMDATGLDYQTLNGYRWVASRFEIMRRRITLSWSHHREVADLEPIEQDEWLDRAETEEWSRNELRKELRKASATEPPPLPEGQYAVILADPPWRYEHNETPDLRSIEENHYATMPVEEIAALEIPAAESAVLFLWATNPKLTEAFTVMAAWGFEYRTNVVWVKDRIGMGYYVRGQHELLLIGKRGEGLVPAEADRPPSVIDSRRTRHSAKPVEAYELIDRMYPSVPRLELFARNEREGWESWGNQLAEAA